MVMTYQSSPVLGAHHNNSHLQSKYLEPMDFVNSLQNGIATKQAANASASSMDYEPTAILGQSAYGEVLLANHTATGKTIVLKKINRLKMNKRLVANEVAAASVLKHSGIVKVHEIFKEGIYTYLVMEHLKGVDFFKYLSAKSFAPIKEKEAKKIFRQLVDIVQYCHSMQFAHRDIKLENIMFDRKKGRVKLIDFGLCERITEKGQLCDLWCGSQDYVCPEIIKKEPYHGFSADVWSLGTILYIMLYGELPFGFDHRVKALAEGKEHPTLHFADERNSNIVPEAAKDLIAGMLHPNPSNRLNIEGVLKHRWMKPKTPLEFLSSWSLS